MSNGNNLDRNRDKNEERSNRKNNKDEQKQLIDKISQEEWRKIEEKSKIDNVHIVSTIDI